MFGIVWDYLVDPAAVQYLSLFSGCLVGPTGPGPMWRRASCVSGHGTGPRALRVDLHHALVKEWSF